MNKARINEMVIVQGNHSDSDAIGLGTNVLQFTVKNLPDSGTNVFVGVNEPASNKNILQPGESVTYYDERCYLDDNALYIAFEQVTVGAPGRALVDLEQ